MAETGNRNDPFPAFNYEVTIGSMKFGCSEIAGLDRTIAPIEYRNGDEPNTVRKLVGLTSYSNITFKRGYTKDLALWTWHDRVREGDIQRESGSITLLNEAHEPVLTWNFDNAWPTKISGPSLNAKNNEVALESLELVVESLVLEAAG
ncbi:MAG: phage tail protein [Anaerolineaceae bacterium]|nr:phage tail protein [Anaerolineaceae bacterium]